MKASNKQQFDEALAAVLKVSHTELKDMLEAEKKAKKKKSGSLRLPLWAAFAATEKVS